MAMGWVHCDGMRLGWVGWVGCACNGFVLSSWFMGVNECLVGVFVVFF